MQRGATGFDAIEQDDGTSAVGFCYRVVAKRKGFEAERLDVCEAARTDAYVYPELRKEERQEGEALGVNREEERTRMEEERQQADNRQ